MHVLIFVPKTLDALSPQWQYSELLSRAALAVVIADGRVLQAWGGALLSPQPDEGPLLSPRDR